MGNSMTSSALNELKQTEINEYYLPKLGSLRDIFGDPLLEVTEAGIATGGQVFPIVDDVIILLSQENWPSSVAERVGGRHSKIGDNRPLGQSISTETQFSFGDEWKLFPDILKEHSREFSRYIDVIPKHSQPYERVCDLGCGIGRWSYFLNSYAKEIVLVDFSEAIFIARKNLKEMPGAIFFMGDILCLPFRDNFADFAICLGVLHHLPVNIQQAVKLVARLSKRFLIYLYYALDNRPSWYRLVWRCSDLLRRVLCRVKSPPIREVLTWILMLFGYLPFIYLGKCLEPLGLGTNLPNFDAHKNDDWKRIRQDVYDRFFTPIENRISRTEISQMQTTLGSIRISEDLPYWHFYAERSG